MSTDSSTWLRTKGTGTDGAQGTWPAAKVETARRGALRPLGRRGAAPPPTSGAAPQPVVASSGKISPPVGFPAHRSAPAESAITAPGSLTPSVELCLLVPSADRRDADPGRKAPASCRPHAACLPLQAPELPPTSSVTYTVTRRRPDTMVSSSSSAAVPFRSPASVVACLARTRVARAMWHAFLNSSMPSPPIGFPRRFMQRSTLLLRRTMDSQPAAQSPIKFASKFSVSNETSLRVNTSAIALAPTEETPLPLSDKCWSPRPGPNTGAL
mmetsp:Transcript_24667/g.68789  ORF Transcript_24667/g.68789 Transcript_24667/m.68789 type:complete len:270 (-) Transcript_24667:484-1293(-)